MENTSIETAFFEACESGDIAQAKMLLALRVFDRTKLVEKRTPEGRTCLHLAVLAGNPDLLKKFKLPQFINKRDNQGDTALHLAVWKYRVDLVTLLLEDKADCKADLSVKNNKGETPLCIGVKFGFLDVMKKLIDHEPKAVQKLCEDEKVLHLAVKLNRAKIVEFLIKKRVVTKSSGILTKLINQRAEVPGIKRPDNEGNRDTNMKVCVDFSIKKVELTDLNDQPNSHPIIQGDTPLHIAARNKNESIVDMLLKVRGVNKHALNSEGQTPLDVAREVTDYYESFRIIKMLTDYKPNPKPFMYCAPEVSQEKHKKAKYMVDKSFDDRRNAELVVAALLATMTFTAVFTVPGGSYQDSENRGTPILLGYYMFKLFIIFDCIAFFLSLFVCIMWQMASELTTEDKILFMSVSGLLTCLSFGFNSFGFMAAVHTILAHKDHTLAWVILGILLFIAFCGAIAFIHQAVMFAVGRARFHRLCGVPRLFDNLVEAVWERAERSGLLKILRSLDEASRNTIKGHVNEVYHNTINEDVGEASNNAIVPTS